MAPEVNPSLLAQFSDELADAVERAGRSVYTVQGGRRQPGSGVAWPGGYIVTADHILFRDFFWIRSGGPRRPPPGAHPFTVRFPEPEQPQEFTVTGADGKNLAATLVGHDASYDLAVLKLAEESALQIGDLAPIGSIRPGNLVFAVGRPTASSVSSSFGAVNAVGERWWTGRGGVIEGYIRADVTMYPGFSGGPLVDVQGRVVGLNSSQLAREHIAIPAAIVDTLVQKLVSGQQVRRAYLGLSSQPTHVPESIRQKAGVDQERGLLVIWVEPESPAEQAGLIVGDVLLRLAGHPVTNGRELLEALTPDRVGKPVQMVVLRGGARQEMTVTPSERG
ncbi:MAG: serine protease [Chloroflexi bacterium]|nr:serine protease [Chloroflexota bacterium]